MTFTGQHLWDENPSIYVDGTGVTITPSWAWAYYEQFQASYSIASDAVSGVHHVVVTTSGGTSNAVEFTVTDPPPQIYSISPDTWDAGSTEYVTI